MAAPKIPYNVRINEIGVNSGESLAIAAGDIVLTWMSRNRHNLGASSVTRTDTIVDDSDFSSFEIEIYEGVNLLRTVTQTSKTYTYTTALQTTDGGPYSAYTFKIRQMNTLLMSGQETVNVTTV
jgi:hypothetical protein